MSSDNDFFVLGNWFSQVFELKNIRWAVFCVDDCSYDHSTIAQMPLEIYRRTLWSSKTAMGSFETVLIVATFLCSLVAGFVFAFAVVVMPGIKNLKDGEFIRAFQVMDRIIQDNQPLFMLVWVGSSLALIVSAGLGIAELTGGKRLLLLVATCMYLFAVQAPTITINIPLNNKLQKLDVEAMNERDQEIARAEFEPRWNRWNAIRTLFASLVSALMIILLLQQ